MWVAMMLLLVSCAAEDAPMERVQVTFTAKIPSEADSRSGESFGQGKYVDRLYCAIYEQGNGGWYFVRRDVVERSGDGFSYAPYLLKGNTYKIAFWAMTEGAYEISEDLTRIIIPVNVSCNNHTKEAFAGVSKEVVVDASNGAPIAVELKRPFAMLNFVTTMNSTQKAKINEMTAEVTITSNGGGLAAFYNVLTGEATSSRDKATYAFATNEMVGTEYVHDHVTYIRLASCYVMPVGTDINVTAQIVIRLNDEVIGNLTTESEIPLTVNYSTNLFGKILK